MHTIIISTKKNNQRGVALLITLLTIMVLLSVVVSLSGFVMKQYELSDIQLVSEMAFQAASAGMECVQYNDNIKKNFDIGKGFNTSINCFGVSDQVSTMGDTNNNNVVDNGEEQRFEFSWGNPSVCTIVDVYKFYEDPNADGNQKGPSLVLPFNKIMDIDRDGNGSVDTCPEGSVCGVVQSQGYNVACSDISNTKNVVEREYTQVY